MTIADVLGTTPVASLDLTRHATVPSDMTVAGVVSAMAADQRSCACVVDDDTLVGIFTQRDYLQRVIGRPESWDRPVAAEMSHPVHTMRNDASLDEGLAVMNEWWIRSVPVLDSDSHLVGSLSYYALMGTIGNLLASRVSESIGEPTVHHGLTLVDFTGINLSAPAVIEADASLAKAVQHMRVRGFGSILVVDSRGCLVGELSEFELLMNVGCRASDLSEFQVGDYVTGDPGSLEARANIADVIQRILDREASHVPLTGESGRPVGVASVREVAAFVETTLEALA